MIEFRHVGVYVSDLQKESDFYKEVFSMQVVVENSRQQDALIADLLQNKESLYITKLITDRGKITHNGDMLELITYQKNTEDREDKIYTPGNMHIGFGVDDIELVVKKILAHGGKKITDIHVMSNGNKCCFLTDPEGIYLELIERS